MSVAFDVDLIDKLDNMSDGSETSDEVMHYINEHVNIFKEVEKEAKRLIPEFDKN